uniref:Uncharacterized protein n=1 Tax=Pseudo-nitzschia australis TaxID=44445 RepID=A0A7S4EKX1_9STRA|mmetsp:Transcript_6031/g.13076  ORF Transcript_6031/g.13076 Transcript_6031/m.13076 type:complete len:578 (+) Transcript_6031:295-2028(+)|eukprot:CAMPEP_0168171674 /NCGR_PEP_ID=MMETSP0139_2-20121125/4826_1 /TAXON_ID=44445 /ORGANISM="Pseudo-nitzschia australis, Strain 10249 10 AB" /LENGTH=577 /DNA_ID=CAMNT_0008089233 /DNA_START=419 /DNA_END=2152 /DNA_ORIENTATION=-
MDHREQRANDGIVVALLDFPKGGTLGLDGQSIVLKTDNFVGVKNLPRETFHLATCKNGNTTNVAGRTSADRNTINTAITVGFIVFGDDDTGGHLYRRYDPRTEEVASEETSPVDDLTRSNLLQQIEASSNPSRVLLYDQIVHGSNNEKNHGGIERETDILSQQRIWGEQTRYINESQSLLLKDIRGLSSGEKIVPGCYDPEDETIRSGPNKNHKLPEVDGKSLVYPPIPVVDPRLSLATHKHIGTKRFLSRLDPSERTKLFLLASGHESSNNTAGFVWLNRILNEYYRNSWQALLGDLQLSYLLFLHLGCYSSLEHWKDLLAMVSLAVDNDDKEEEFGNDGKGRGSGRKQKHDLLYQGLLRLLPYQLSGMTDPEFLEDIDEGGGNFLIPSLARLNRYYEAREREIDRREEEQNLISKFRHVLSAKFPRTFFSYHRLSGQKITRLRSNSNDDNKCDACTDAADNMDVDGVNETCFGADEDFEDDEDGPVMVSSEEIEASLARSDCYASNSLPAVAAAAATYAPSETTAQLRKEYPLLAAAVMPHEDVLMTCARALDEQNDVSLVREAAAYLNEVEQQR